MIQAPAFFLTLETCLSLWSLMTVVFLSSTLRDLPASKASEVVALFGENLSNLTVAPPMRVAVHSVGLLRPHWHSKEVPHAHGGSVEGMMRWKVSLDEVLSK